MVAYTWNREKQMFIALGKEFDMFSQNLPISASFAAILKITLPQCNAIGVAHRLT